MHTWSIAYVSTESRQKVGRKSVVFNIKSSYSNQIHVQSSPQLLPEFWIKNAEFCIKYDELCITNDEWAHVSEGMRLVVWSQPRRRASPQHHCLQQVLTPGNTYRNRISTIYHLILGLTFLYISPGVGTRSHRSKAGFRLLSHVRVGRASFRDCFDAKPFFFFSVCLFVCLSVVSFLFFSRKSGGSIG